MERFYLQGRLRSHRRHYHQHQHHHHHHQANRHRCLVAKQDISFSSGVQLEGLGSARTEFHHDLGVSPLLRDPTKLGRWLG